MYIRKTTTRKAVDGTPYATFRIVASERVQGKVKQRILLNLGSSFDLQETLWPELCKKIHDILIGNLSLVPAQYEIEKYAQDFAARILAENSLASDRIEETNEEVRYEEVDVSSLELIRPRSIGVEHLALHGAQLIKLPDILQKTGFSQTQVSAALGSIVGRMAKPASEAATWKWLSMQSALGELLDRDFSENSPMSLYRISDKLLQHKEEIEERLFSQIRSLFSLKETVTLYDLTNTYFEGEMKNNKKAARGFSKEKRFDCPLLTLGLVLDASGFVKKSKVFAGNASEAGTAKDMLTVLGASPGSLVVMDCGIATKATLDWLVAEGYQYLVVSREHARVFDMSKAQTIRTAQEQDLHIYRELNADGMEARLYCYSSHRAAKEQGIVNRFSKNFETALQKLSDALAKPRTNKRKDVILQRIGRLTEKSHGISRHYLITVTDNAETKSVDEPILATSIKFEKKPVAGTIVTHPGVYCLRTNAIWLEAEEMWKTYIMLTDLEAVFRSLKSEFGLRPVYHQTSHRADGHFFITVLAYQCVQAIRSRLKKTGITDSWRTIREIMCTQQRVTVTFQQRNGSTVHIRKTTRPEANQQQIYASLHIDSSPGGVKRHTVPRANANM
jgi:transposase